MLRCLAGRRDLRPVAGLLPNVWGFREGRLDEHALSLRRARCLGAVYLTALHSCSLPAPWTKLSQHVFLALRMALLRVR